MIVCNRCGKENQDHYKFCLGCGGELGLRAGATTPGAATIVDDRGREGAVSDGNSGRAASTEALGAAKSTAKVPTTKPSIDRSGLALPAAAPATDPGMPPTLPTMRTCPVCGNQVPFEFVFCGQCGTRLGEGAPQRTLHMTQPRAPEPQVRGKLILIRPDGSEGGFFPLHDGENVVGRGENLLFESDNYLSPRHATFQLQGEELRVHDEGSLNGVFLKMTVEEEILDGETFRMGQELIRFNVIPPAQPLEDGTEIMGSPNPGYWGRLSLIIGRNQDGSAFPLYGESMVVGRERGDILFPEDGYVSGTHARISIRDGRYYLTDLNSSNGSFMRVRGERAIPNGSFLLMGQQLFRVQYT